ncbi:MAG: hypothetical protein H3C64_08295 [Candidatus Kuenenia stuttgartiensis]|nr:hypothetical protein [Candidatus Kuenenia stuttgartiensis]
MISGSVIHGLNILVVMVSYPIYIKYLGFGLFSVWSLLSVIISFALMGNLGIGRAVVTMIAYKANNSLIVLCIYGYSLSYLENKN